MKKRLLCVFGVFAFVGASLLARGDEVIGWRTRGVTNVPVFNPALAPSLPAFTAKSVITNASTGGANMRLAVTPAAANFTPGLSTALPASDRARIVELARGLDFDWWKCYCFIRDNIAYAPYHGILRGPERTLLDREGNDADQAFLLLALLRASGHDTATVVYEPLVLENEAFTSGFYMPLYDYDGNHPYNAASWLDVPATGTVGTVFTRIATRLWTAGRPAEYAAVGNVPAIVTDHFWIVLSVDNLLYHLDPSFKPTGRIGARDVAIDMGYMRAALISSAGGTVGANHVRNLSSAGLESKLDALCRTLGTVWTNANFSVARYVGGSSIVPQADSACFHGFTILNSPYDFLQQTAAFQNLFRASVTLTHGTLTRQFFLDELGARQLWVSYAAAGTSHPKAVLHLDDEVIASETTSASTAAATMTLAVGYEPASMTADYDLTRSLSNVYAIPAGFGGDARGGMRTWATDALSRLRATGVAATDVRMLARSLQVAGQQWLAQTALATKMHNALSGDDMRNFYNLGVAGQVNAPYVDMKNSYGYSTSDPAMFDGGMLFSSALEHAVLDQLNGTNAPSVSTVKILELANATGNPVYFASSANYATIKNSLVNYSASQKASFQEAVTAGRRLLLPQNAMTTLNQWSGCGYIEHGPTPDGAFSSGMIIAGGMNGGFGTVDNMADNVAYVENTQPTTTYANGGVQQTVQADPVSMPSGAYLDGRTDLAVAGGTPLAWTRHYDSRGRFDDGDLGRGWSHNYEASIVECADPDAVFGRTSVAAAIPTAVAMTVVDDMLADQTGISAGETARRWMIAALAVQWWTKRLTLASVSVNLGAQSLMFQRRPDGTFAPYPGVTATLALANGIYTLTERLGPTYTFNADKRLASIKDRSGNVTALTYNSSKKLTKIQNAFGASFSVVWNGERISKVTDNAGRSVRYAYNADGCLTTVTDPRAKNWSATYDAEDFMLLTQTNPEGETTIRNAYNAFEQVTNQVSAIGQSWTFGYASSVSAWDEDPLGNRLTQSYTSEGRVLQKVDRDGAMTDYAYDGNGHVVARMDALGRIDSFDYDGSDNLLRSVDDVDYWFRLTDFAYDSASRLVAVTNALGQVTTFAYDAHDRLLAKTLPDGSSVANTWSAKGLLLTERLLAPDSAELRRTTYTYGSRGLPLTKTVTGVGLPTVGVAESYTYSTAGLLLSVTDANGHVTAFTYDANGKLLTTTDPAGKVTTRTYTAAGRLNTVTDALGRTTTSRWTPSGKLAARIHADGTTTTNIYDAVDDLAMATDARGATVSFVRDEMGRVLSRTTAMETETYAYNAMGYRISATDGANITTRVSYDGLYRPVVVQNALDAQWWTDYDLLDRATAAEDPRGKIRTTAYDTLGRRIASGRPSGATDRFGYDGFGNLTSHTNAEGHVYAMAYDALGRMLTATDATGRQVVSNVYDGVGNLLTRTDGNGVTLSCTYDACDRLTGRMGPGVSDAFTYDAVGNLLAAANDTASENFSYDVMNRLSAATTTVGGHAFTTSWARDAGGLVTNVAYGAGWSVTRTYDADGRLVGVSDGLGHAWTFTYDGAGKPTGGMSPDGTTHAFTYDAAGRLSGWNVGTIAGRTITRDAAGRRIRDTVTAGTMPRASADRHAENVFDAADRIVSATVTYGVTNTPVAEFYLHDGNGALTNVVTAGANTFEAAYTAQGQLAALGVQTFAYDALGNRVAVAGRIWIPDHSDPLKRPLLECAADGTVLRRYVWGNGRLLGFVDAAGALTIAHGDEQGSVIALTDLDGNVLHTAHYGPHGEDWGATGVNPTPFAWLGGHGVKRLPAYGTLVPLYLTRHRLYSATLKCFLSSDPLGLSGGLNLYAYAEGNPLAYIDPLGLCGTSTWGAAASDFFEYMGTTDYWHEVSEFYKGYGDAVVGTVEGLYNVVAHPVQTIENLGAAMAHPVQTASAIYDSVTTSMATSRGAGAVVGNVLIMGGMAAASFASTTSKAGQVAQIATKIDAVIPNEVATGTKVFRVWGDGANAMGHSWTTIDPRAVSGYRNVAGLPVQNTGRFLSEGILNDTKGVSIRSALPLNGNTGGIPELLVPNPAGQINLRNVQGLNPQL